MSFWKAGIGGMIGFTIGGPIGGIFGAIIYWTPIFLTQIYLFACKQNFLIRNCAIILGFLMIFFHMKESALYVRMLFPAYALLFFYSILDNSYVQHLKKQLTTKPT